MTTPNNHNDNHLLNNAMLTDGYQQQPPPSPPPTIHNNVPTNEDKAAAEVDEICSRVTLKMHEGLLELVQKTLNEEFGKRRAMEKEEVPMLIETNLKNNEDQEHSWSKQTYDFFKVKEEKVSEEGSGSAPAASAQQEPDMESNFNPNNGVSLDIMCIRCRSEPASVLWLSCRHLCLCYFCDANSVTCPICNSPKMANVIVYHCGFHLSRN